MKTIIAAVIILVLSSTAFAATATLTNVQVKTSGVVMYLSIDDTGNAGIFEMFIDVSNDMMLQYSAWAAFRDAVVIPAVQAAIAEKRAIVTRAAFLTSKVDQSINIP